MFTQIPDTMYKDLSKLTMKMKVYDDCEDEDFLVVRDKLVLCEKLETLYFHIWQMGKSDPFVKALHDLDLPMFNTVRKLIIVVHV